MCAFEIVLTKLPFPEAGLVSFSQQRVNAASSTFLQEHSFCHTCNLFSSDE